MSAVLAELPQLLNPRPDDFPAALKADKRWAPCHFAFDPRRGKYDKLPLGGKLTVNEPDRWWQFDAARAVQAGQSRRYQGMCYVLTGHRGLVSIDLDNCVDGGQLVQWAAEVVQQAGSYAEISPSGTGVHVFVLADLDQADGPQGRDWTHRLPDGGGVEVYGGGSGRHITLTGHLVPGAAADVLQAPAPFLAWLWARYPRQGALASPAAAVGLPDLADAPPLAELSLPPHVRAFLEQGDSAGGDRSRLIAAAAAAAYADGLSDGQVLRLLHDNEHAMQVALEHRRDDADAALRYLWEHHCCKYRDKVGGVSAVEFHVIESVDAALPATPPATVPLQVADAFPPPYPGPMAALVQAVLDVAPKPQPELATLAALVAMAAACPGSVRTAGGMRLNLYGLGVAATGAGKDLPRSSAIELAIAAGAKIIGRPASGQGLEDELETGRGMLAEIDEVAHMLQASNAPGAPTYLIELASVLLKLFSASQGHYNTRVLAKVKGASAARNVRSPCFNLLGFTTPQKLGQALTFGNIADGLAGRMLFVRGRDYVIPRMPRGAFTVPPLVRERAEELQHAIAVADLVHDSGDTVIAGEPDADALREQLLVDLEQRPALGDADFAHALFVRAWEKVERIAGVLAVWDNPREPVMRRAHVEWARSAVLASDAAFLDFAKNHMHASTVQADAARVLEILRKCISGALKGMTAPDHVALRNGMATRSMVLKHSKLDSQRFDAAVAHLGQLGDVTAGDLPKDLCEGGRRVRALKLEVAE